MNARRSLLLAALALSCAAWLDPHAQGREGNRLYAAGKYNEAAAKYNEALTDEPDSAALHLNLGAALYKQGKYDDAIKAVQQVPLADDNPARAAAAGLVLGNAKCKLGEAAEASDPKTALTSYAEALVTYRRAMGVAPADQDLKFNYEFVDEKLADLKKKLEEQQKQQEQQQQDQQQGDQGEHQNDQQQGEQQQEPQEQQPEAEQPQQAQEPKQPEGDQQQAGAAEEGAKEEGELSQQEAAALLDSQKDQEVSPDEVIRKLHGAAVAEPAQDW